MRGDGNRNRDGLDSYVCNEFTGSASGLVFQAGSVHGDVHLHSRRHRYDLRPFSEPRRPDPAELRVQPSQLLLAANRVVPFTGRETELARLRQWLNEPWRIGATLMFGPGGQGKTRLADEFAAESAHAGWTVAVAHHASDFAGSNYEQDSRPTGRGLLVIVDYAERWPRSDLLALFEDGRIRHSGPTRVLLLARSGSRWWDLLRYPLHKLGVRTKTEQLTELAADTRSRTAVFDSARDSFASVLGTDTTGVRPAGSLTDNAYRSVLTIHMAALAAVDACDHDWTPPAHPGALASYLLDRETDHWARMRSAGTIESSTNVVARIVFLATLTGPMSYSEGSETVRITGLASNDAEAGRLLDDHLACYPSTDDAAVLTSLSPDRMGEDFIARCLPGGDEPGDPRTPELISRMLTLSSLRRAQVITVLAEASKRWPHVARHLAALVREDPDRLITAGGGALMAVVDTADPDLLATIEPHLPEHRHVDLDYPAARLTQRLTSLRLDRTGDPAARAKLHLVLGRKLANAGDFDAALKASEQAVDIYERMVRERPGWFEADLAEALHHLGSHFAAAGYGERALNATNRAVALRRQLAESNPAAHDSSLASSLNNQALDLADVGLHGPALRIAQEAVAIQRRLVAGHRSLHEPDLATALNTVAMHLSDAGRHQEAFEAAREAMQLHLQLAKTNRMLFEPDLAASLHNFGHHCAQLDRWDLALVATEEAVSIRKRLATANPSRFEPELATSLRELAAVHFRLGRVHDAVSCIGQAVHLHNNLMLVSRAAFQAELATSLHNQGIYLAHIGNHDQAMACARQAWLLRSNLFEDKLGAYELQLNTMLIELGIALPDSPRTSESPDESTEPLAAEDVREPLPPENADEPLETEEAGVRLSLEDARELQQQVNEIFLESTRGIPQSTDNLAERSTTAHRLTAALCSSLPQQADLLTPVAAKLITLEAQLARTLSNLSTRLVALGRQTDALRAAEQAAAIHERLAHIDPTHRADSAVSLANVGTRLVEFGRRDQALAATKLAVERIRDIGIPPFGARCRYP